RRSDSDRLSHTPAPRSNVPLFGDAGRRRDALNARDVAVHSRRGLMSGLDLGSGSTVPVLTGRRSVGARRWFVIGLLVLVPIPLLALSGIGLPLPSVIERGLAAILPGGSSPRVPAGPGSPARSTPTSSLKRPVSLHTGGSATLTRPHRPSTGGSGGSSSPRDPNTGDPTAAPGGPGTDGGSGPTVGTGTPPGTSGVGA